MTEKEQTARIFKAFCDPNRLTILELLQSGEKCACRLLDALQIGQPTLSHHMRILCDAGIVRARKEGKWMYYSLDASGAARAQGLLRELTTEACDAKCDCCKE